MAALTGPALTGPDVSHHQGPVDWARVAAAGHAFAWCKATEGVSFRDSRFAANWAAARAAGLVRGAYHFLRSDSDPRAQARWYLATVGDLAGSMAAVDVESSGASRPTAAHARAFVDEIRRLASGHPVVVYTGRWYWRDLLGDPHGADLGPLWHSAYSTVPGPLYGAWAAYTFWQWTSSGTCPGVAGRCDLNHFYGNHTALHALTRPQEDDMDPAQEQRLLDAIGVVRSKVEHTFNQVNRRTGTLANQLDTLAAAVADALAQAPGVDEDQLAEAIAQRIPASLADKVVDAIHHRTAPPPPPPPPGGAGG